MVGMDLIYLAHVTDKWQALRFQESRHTKVVRLSALRTGHLYPPGNIPGTHFC
jgi:hypothetical protein